MVLNIFYFHPEPWGNDPIWRAYFSNGLVQPPTSLHHHHHHHPRLELGDGWNLFPQQTQWHVAKPMSSHLVKFHHSSRFFSLIKWRSRNRVGEIPLFFSIWSNFPHFLGGRSLFRRELLNYTHCFYWGTWYFDGELPPTQTSVKWVISWKRHQ